MIGRVLKKYRILAEVGQGGMAVVYKGLDTVLEREVAIKVLHPHLAGHPESKLRLEREAHAVAKLHHDNILEIFDYSGREEPDSFIVTEFIRGRTLRAFLEKQKKIAFPEIAAMIVLEIVEALRHAHERGIVHRDVKPENVMIREDGVLKLMDFGIAQIVDKERMTATGQLLGSPAYMAPEHVEGKPIDTRTDLFSTGIVLYQLATGELPFKGKNAHEILKRIAECRFLDARVINPAVGERLGRILAKTLAREPEARYQDAAALAADVDAYLAEAELTNVRAELHAYFGDPHGYVQALRPRLVAALARRGREARARGETAAALELWNRALTINPDDKEVLDELRAIERRLRRRRALLGAAGLLAAAGLAVVIAPRMSRRREARVARAPIEPPSAHGAPVALPAPAREAAGLPISSPPPPAATSAGAAERSPREAEPAPAGAPARRPISAPAQAAAERDVAVSCFPKSFDLYVDGRRIGNFTDGSAAVRLSSGRHRVWAANPDCCFTAPPELVPAGAAAAGPLRFHLSWKPGLLDVTGAPGTTLLVEGVSYVVGANGRLTSPVTVPIRSEDSREQRITLTLVTAAGQRTVDVTAVAGKTIPVDLGR